MESLPEDWKSILDEDPYLPRAQAKAQGEGQLRFSTLAPIWLHIISEVGMRGIDPATGSPPKEEATYHPKAGALYSYTLPVRFNDKRYPNRKNDRRYLLRGLVRCATCGGACTGHQSNRRGKKYYYYACRAAKTYNFGATPRINPPSLAPNG